MRLRIKHTTQFHYDEPPAYGLLQLRTSPRSSSAQTVVNWKTDLTGAQEQAQFVDQHGNQTALIEVLSGAQLLELSVSGDVETYCEDGIFGRHDCAMPLSLYRRQTKLTSVTEALKTLANTFSPKSEDSLTALHDLSHRIRDDVSYMPGQTNATTTAGDALKNRKGVCQDHSHIFLSCVRQKGYSARYVSGYLLMDGQVSQDASHAWAEVYLDGLGWVGFDISNGISPDQRYVKIAQGLDYSDAAPTRGLTRGAGQENLIVSIQVQQ
ncbi:MAG: transglutaminase family protein [Pseudomonadota bacterium]